MRQFDCEPPRQSITAQGGITPEKLTILRRLFDWHKELDTASQDHAYLINLETVRQAIQEEVKAGFQQIEVEEFDSLFAGVMLEKKAISESEFAGIL